MIGLEDLIKQSNDVRTRINGRWVPARSINFKYRSLKERLREAWAVFTGKSDCFIWPEGQ